MRPALRLLVVTAEASFLVAVGWFGVAVISVKSFPEPNGPTIAQGIMLSIPFVIVVGLATWMSFRKLRTCYPRREVRALTIAVAVFVPLWAGVSMPLAQFVAGIPGLASPHSYGLLGSLILAIGITTSLLTFAVCAVVLRITRRIARAEQYNP